MEARASPADPAALWQLERRFWIEGPQVYREHMRADGLMAFVEPVGVLDKPCTLEALAAAPRWDAVEFAQQRAVQAGADCMLLSYLARASRAGNAYAARCVSVYALGGPQPALVFHQQTPADTTGG